MARSKNNLKAVLNDIAEAIRDKKGTSNLICPRDFADEIRSIPAAGNQPTLFPPIITVNSNIVSWTTNPDNGGFTVSNIGTIDGVVVGSPFTITEEYNNKILKVTSYSYNFQEAFTEQVLKYLNH